MEILNVDVYGNLSCILKGRISDQAMQKFI